MLCVIISIDEMTMYFKGSHVYKIKMTYKSEGDVLQEDDICQKGYTYQIFMCTDTGLKTYLAKILSPLYDIFTALFDNVE